MLLQEFIRVFLKEDAAEPEWEKHALGQERGTGELDVPSERRASHQLERYVDGGGGISKETIALIRDMADDYPNVLKPAQEFKTAYRVILITKLEELEKLKLHAGHQTFNYKAGGGGGMSQTEDVSSWTTSYKKIGDLAMLHSNFHSEYYNPSGYKDEDEWDYPAWVVVFSAPIQNNGFYLNWKEVPMLFDIGQDEVLLFGDVRCTANVTQVDSQNELYQFSDTFC